MWLSPGQHAANCCVFKTHSVAGPLPRKVHFPFPIQPHGLSSATVFSLRQRQPPAAVWAPTPSPSAHFDPSVLDSHHPSDPPQNCQPWERSWGMTFKPFAESETSWPLVRCPIMHIITCCVWSVCPGSMWLFPAIDLLAFELCCHMTHLLPGV